MENLFIRLNIHKNWWNLLIPLFQSKEMSLVQSILAKVEFQPSKEKVFDFFKVNPDIIKVLVLGDLQESINQVEFYKYRQDFTPIRLERDTLDYWNNQGIYVLDYSLTYSKNEDHSKYWSFFIEAVVFKLKECGVYIASKGFNPLIIEKKIKYLNNYIIHF